MTSDYEPSFHEDGLGGSITILERGDQHRAMRFRMVLPRGFGPPARERHPSQREDFYVLRGTLDLGEIGGKRVRLGPGERFSLPPGTYHLPANAGDDAVEFEGTLSPGLDAASMFIELYCATREHRGLGQFTRVMAIMWRYRRTISFPLPVRIVMRLVAAAAPLIDRSRRPAPAPSLADARQNGERGVSN